MRTKRVQKRAIPWSILWGIASIAGVIIAGSIGPGPQKANANPDLPIPAAAPPSNTNTAVTARSCIACHRFEQVLTHPTNVMASMPVPNSLPLAGGLVTCLTCHDASPEHATTRKPVGVRADTGAGLCMDCHAGAKNSSKAIHAPRGGRAHLGTKSAFDSHAHAGTADGESVSCMACHDGSSASDAGSHAVKHRADEMLPDHPIGIPMRETSRSRESDFRLSRNPDKRIRLFSGNLGCGSCHSIYSREPGQLVVNNRGSKLCLSCHTQ